MASLSNIPDQPHIALITISSRTIYTPGDERSRLYPGHGYPESTETVTSFEYEVYYENEGDMKMLEAKIATLHRFKREFKIQRIAPMKVETSIKISLK